MKEKSRFRHFNIQRVPQGQNEEANRLARLASSVAKSLNPGIIVEYLSKTNTEVEKEREVNMASSEPE